jgi:hypothetical protein
VTDETDDSGITDTSSVSGASRRHPSSSHPTLHLDDPPSRSLLNRSVLRDRLLIALFRTLTAHRPYFRDGVESPPFETHREAVEAALTRTDRRLAQGDKLREKSSTAAIAQYATAWREAQTALDIVDAATEPQVTITSRPDPRHNGTISYVVRGTVFDVRPYELDNATVSVNGETRATVPPEGQHDRE